MLSSTLSLASLLSLSSALVISNRQNAGYYYMPVEFDYGADSRVTAQFILGSAEEEPIQVVMDTGSANFWVRLSLPRAPPHLTHPRSGRQTPPSIGAPNTSALKAPATPQSQPPITPRSPPQQSHTTNLQPTSMPGMPKLSAAPNIPTTPSQP